MPAISLPRLKIQAADLAVKVDNPAEFRRSLHDLLGFYADRVYRPGQVGAPKPLLPTYHVPQPVLRQILRELTPWVKANREAALLLADELWGDSYYEVRLLAILLLGEIDPEPIEDIFRRVHVWIKPNTEIRLIDAMFESGLSLLLQVRLEDYLEQSKQWLSDPKVFPLLLGIKSLFPLVNSPGFLNLPLIFHLLAPLMRTAPGSLRLDLLAIIKALAKRSPKETAFFLRESLVAKTENLNSAWLIRHSLTYFPLAEQASLRTALRESA